MFMNIYEINNFQGNVMELVVDSNYYFSCCDDLSSVEAEKVVKAYLYDSYNKMNIPSIISVYMDYSTNQIRIALKSN